MFRYWLNQNNSKIQLINLASLTLLDFDVIFMRLQNLGTLPKTAKSQAARNQKAGVRYSTYSHWGGGRWEKEGGGPGGVSQTGSARN